MTIREVKQKILEKEYSHLNPMQQQAVFCTDGPLLILAGAGSGKTTVLVNKIEYAIRFGNALESKKELSEMERALLEAYLFQPDSSLKDTVDNLLAGERVWADSVLAFTFTNKAAGELKERLNTRLGETASDIWAGTFHSICVRILRQDIEKLGYDKSFTIYDADDQKKLMKDILKSMNLEEKLFPPAGVLGIISKAKDKMITADEFEKTSLNDYRMSHIAKAYHIYEEKLRYANALDFDDLILLTVRLLQENEESRNHWQRKFSHVYVDEFQDTNPLQYRLVRLLSGGQNNLTVVGDDDQSIYRFRGATIENILHFEEDYPDTKVIRLEQNYRSTGVILDAANRLISNNSERKGKTLWTARKGGEKITCVSTENEYNEARYITDEIQRLIAGQGYHYSDFALLYRNNAQSNALEDSIRKNAIPYKIVKGMKFFDRAEIKDVVAYLTLLVNPRDDVRLKRIINEPKRGIGDATVDVMMQVASVQNTCAYDVALHAENYPQTQRMAAKLHEFTDVIEDIKSKIPSMLPSEVTRYLLNKTGYYDYAKNQDDADGKDRIENIESFVSGIEFYETENGDNNPSLLGYLQEVSLVSELDAVDGNGEYVSLLTIHAAKGLEFPVVFVTGMEEGIFPSMRALDEPGGEEEERRLAYVALTRAQKLLYLTRAVERKSYYGSDYHTASRFLREIPEETYQIKELVHQTPHTEFYHPAKTTFRPAGTVTRPTAAMSSKKAPAFAAALAPGDKVSHDVFGTGTVRSVRPMGGDALIEISFDSGETKKLMQNYAKIEKIGN